VPVRYTYQSIWGATSPPLFVEEAAPVTVGLRVKFHAPGRIVGARYYRGPGSIGGNIAYIKPSPDADQIYAVALFHHRNAVDGPEEGEWQNCYFPRPYVRVEEDDTRLLGVNFRQGYYWSFWDALLGGPVVSGDLEVLQDDGGAHNGLYSYESSFDPYLSYASSMYGIDVLFLADHQLTP
jgi:hypothetical protein